MSRLHSAKRPASAVQSLANLDRRKARIVACFHPTRIKRGFMSDADCKRLGAVFGVSGRTVRSWGDAGGLPGDEQVSAIEQWLAAGPVYRYAGVDRIVGPETWPDALAMTAPGHQGATETDFLASVAGKAALWGGCGVG